ncbi:MAG TPA: carbon-nitrogen hydrolase family protein [Methylomirabilota bacterium]|jgi:predicted amidohydrolase|nr:carbon-nitrogen hydrolase family protein [Methylomirabilota bacterium]
MGFKLALVQPLAHRPPDDARNVADAIRHVEAAARQGAAVVAFPETYPGPWRMPARFDPTDELAGAARRCGVYVQFGTLEPLDDGSRRAHNVLLLARPSGGTPGRYRRTHPPGPWIYTGGAYWEFEYVPGEDFPVFETEHGVFGLAMCSEVYVPEVSRALALRGAEVIFLPAGVDKLRLWASWRNLIWSRAIENLAVVVTTQNLFGPDQRGLAMVATPEEVVFESTQPGMFLLDIDLARVRDLRAQRDGVGSQIANAAKAGVLTQWQRPELYDKMLPKSRDGGPTAPSQTQSPD